MENLDINSILDRNNIENNIIKILDNFSVNNNYKKGIYLYGDSGIGKSKFIFDILEKNNYDILYYDNSIIRNKNLIENICSNNLSNRNIYSMLCNKEKKIVIVIDDIDSMNCGDKNGILSLIKLIREKKTKKQKLENVTNNPVICINNRSSDKKTLELMKVCNVFEMLSPTNEQIKKIIYLRLPNIYNYLEHENKTIENNIIKFLNNKLSSFNKLIFYYENDFIYKKFYIHNVNGSNYENNNINIKLLTKKLLSNSYNFNDNNFILESDRTITSLLLHENIVKVISINELDIYLEILNNFIFSDYIDRIIFQKQIWQLTDYNYIIKLFYNNFILSKNKLLKQIDISEIIFTKILTKYSSEYNNYMFIYSLLQIFLLDKKDLYIKILELSNENNINEVLNKLKYININKLEIVRIIKFINYILYDDLISKNESIEYDINITDEYWQIQ